MMYTEIRTIAWLLEVVIERERHYAETREAFDTAAYDLGDRSR